MAVTLTVTPVPSLGYVELDFTATGAVTELWRTDDNGTRPVRTLDGLLPTTSAVTEDYEAALTGTVTYTAVTATESDTADTTLETTATWLSVPIAPAWSTTLDLVTGLDAERAAMGTVHEVIGREDPLPTLGGLRKRAGTLTIFCATWEKARAVENLHNKSAVLLLRQPDYPGMDLWYVPERVTVAQASEDTSPRRWLVTVTYREVNAQTGPLSGTLGRDYADVVAEHPTYLDALATYSTYADLQTGPTP